MGRLGDPKALGIVLQEKIICQDVANGWTDLSWPFHPKSKLRSLNPKVKGDALA